jgi:hypothetical protein
MRLLRLVEFTMQSPPIPSSRFLFLTALTWMVMSGPATAGSLDLAIAGTGLSLGDSEQIRGVRINLFDRHLRHVDGINVTLLKSLDPWQGTVHGLALGGAPGLKRLNGVGLGLLGVGTEKDLNGVAVGGVGVGAGGDATGILGGLIGAGVGGNARGLFAGGVGCGIGNDLTGIAFGLVGAGVGGDAHGVVVGGVGSGIGGDLTGISVGGIGGGIGGDLRGLSFGLIGTGVGGDAAGVLIGGVGQGVGGDFKGLSLSVVGAGVGGDFHGIGGALGGLGVGNHLRGIAVGGIMLIAPDVEGITAALLNGASFSNFSLDRVNDRYRGLAIGGLNYSRELHGIQLGLLNYAGNNPPWARWLPFINVHF